MAKDNFEAWIDAGCPDEPSGFDVGSIGFGGLPLKDFQVFLIYLPTFMQQGLKMSNIILILWVNLLTKP